LRAGPWVPNSDNIDFLVETNYTSHLESIGKAW